MQVFKRENVFSLENLIVFIVSFFFGLPSIEKFMKKQTYMAIRTKIEQVPSPAVSVFSGWNQQFKSSSLPPLNCTDSHSTAQDVWSCILSYSYNISDVIMKDSHNGTWRTEMTDPWAGITWTQTVRWLIIYRYLLDTGGSVQHVHHSKRVL